MWLRLGHLSPRRRVFAVSLAAVLAVAVAVVIVGVIQASGGGDAQVDGFPPQDRPGPVLLVPGYGGNIGSLSVLAARIVGPPAARPLWCTCPATAPAAWSPTPASSMPRRRVRCAVARPRSMWLATAGGVIALLWAREDGGAHKARRVVTLARRFTERRSRLGRPGTRHLAPARPPVSSSYRGSSLLSGLTRPGRRRGHGGCRCGPPTTRPSPRRTRPGWPARSTCRSSRCAPPSTSVIPSCRPAMW